MKNPDPWPCTGPFSLPESPGACGAPLGPEKALKRRSLERIVSLCPLILVLFVMGSNRQRICFDAYRNDGRSHPLNQRGETRKRSRLCGLDFPIRGGGRMTKFGCFHAKEGHKHEGRKKLMARLRVFDGARGKDLTSVTVRRLWQAYPT